MATSKSRTSTRRRPRLTDRRRGTLVRLLAQHARTATAVSGFPDVCECDLCCAAEEILRRDINARY